MSSSSTSASRSSTSTTSSSISTSTSSRAATSSTAVSSVVSSSTTSSSSTLASSSFTTSVRSSSSTASSSKTAAAAATTGAGGTIINSSAAESSSSSGGLSGGAIGGIVGGVLGGLLAALLAVWIWRSMKRRNNERKYPLPPPRSMSYAPGGAPVPITLTAARRASSYGNLMAPATPGSYSRRTSSSHLSSSQHQRNSSYSQGPGGQGRPPLSPSSSPARRLSFESTSQLPRHTGLGGGLSTPPDALSTTPTSSESNGSPQLLPVDADYDTPLPRSMGAEPSSSSNSPPSSRSNSSHSSDPSTRSSSQNHQFPSRPNPHPINTSSSNTLLGPSYPNRTSRRSIASSTTSSNGPSRSRSYGPTSSLGPGIALRSGVPHGGRGVNLQMPAPLGPPTLPTTFGGVPTNSWANGLSDQERRWDGGRERERSRSSTGMERRQESSTTSSSRRASRTPVEEEEGEFEDENEAEGSNAEQERQRRP